MRTESGTERYSSPALIPWHVVRVEALPDLRLSVRFADGLTGIVDLARLAHAGNAGVFTALTNPGFFAQVDLEHGAVTWPGGLDLAPDAMHDALKLHGVWII